MRLLIAMLLALCILPSRAQGPQTRNEAVVAKMREFAFLVGEWIGEGWSMIEGKRETSTVEERVFYKAGDTVLSVEGAGKDSTGRVVHNAFGILYMDSTTKEYRLRSFVQSGMSGEFKVTAKDGVVVWTIPGQRTIRYTIKLDRDGRWHEVGEIDMGEGKWYQFMEMKLKKVK